MVDVLQKSHMLPERRPALRTQPAASPVWACIAVEAEQLQPRQAGERAHEISRWRMHAMRVSQHEGGYREVLPGTAFTACGAAAA